MGVVSLFRVWKDRLERDHPNPTPRARLVPFLQHSPLHRKAVSAELVMGSHTRVGRMFGVQAPMKEASRAPSSWLLT